MTKKLLPAMIGAALVGGMAAAQADVTVFGHIDTSVVNWDLTEKTNGIKSTIQDDTNFECTTCSIGFKGSEDLGNGLKAIFKLDFQYDTIERNPKSRDYFATTSTTAGTTTVLRSGTEKSSITDRDQWLGLAGNFGQVRIGTISTVYKSHGAMIDPAYRTVLQARDVGLQSRFHRGAGEDGQGRAESTLRYDSPSWNGLQVGAYYTLDTDENDGIVSPLNPTGTEDDDAYGAGASYTNGGILVFADYITNNGDAVDNAAGDMDAWKVGGKYTINNLTVYGQYEDASTDTGAGLTKSTSDESWWHVGGTYIMGNNGIHVAYGQYDEDCGTGCDYSYDVYSIIGTHSLSKRTMAYAGYFDNNGDGKDTLGGVLKESNDYTGFGAGLKHKF